MKLATLMMLALIAPSFAFAENVLCTVSNFEDDKSVQSIEMVNAVKFDIDKPEVVSADQSVIGKSRYNGGSIVLLDTNFLDVQVRRSVNPDRALVVQVRKRNQDQGTLRAVGVGKVQLIVLQESGTYNDGGTLDPDYKRVPKIDLSVECFVESEWRAKNAQYCAKIASPGHQQLCDTLAANKEKNF